MPNYPEALNGETRPDSEEGLEEAAALGRRIRAVRKQAGFTLDQLSAASGVSRAALSKIERGEMSPTYESLTKLARGFGTDLATLISGRATGTGGCEVTRAGAGASYETDRFAHRFLAPGLPDRSLFAFVTEIRATQLSDFDRWDRHDSEDFVYILDGVVAVHMDGREPVELHPGDSLQMDGRIPHALITVSGADGDAPARLLWVSVPY